MNNDAFADLVKGKISNAVYENVKDVPDWARIGQRVKAIANHDGKPLLGRKGTIRVLKLNTPYTPSAGVEWDEDIGGHDLYGEKNVRVKYGHGWFIDYKKLIPLNED